MGEWDVGDSDGREVQLLIFPGVLCSELEGAYAICAENGRGGAQRALGEAV